MNTGILKKLILGLAGLSIIAAGVAAYVFFVRLGYLPTEAKREISSTQVGANVEVYRDAYGVPHIYGDSTDDALFALGYAMAEDRLAQIEMTRRAAMGELAQVLGADLIQYDKQARQKAYTQQELADMISAMPADSRRGFLSMVAGINHYVQEAIDKPDNKLPIEFQSLNIELKPYSATDILASIANIMRIFGSSGGTELSNQTFLQEMTKQHGSEIAQRIFDDILPLNDPDAYTIVGGTQTAPLVQAANKPQAVAQLSVSAQVQSMAMQKQNLAATEVLKSVGLARGASRTIVIGPERSATGKPLILQGTADGSEVHLSSPGINFAGLAIAPMGLPVQGRGPNTGVVITTGERDTVDVFGSATDPENSNRYFYQGEWKQLQLRTETIAVKGGEAIEFEVARTVYGPVVLRDTDNHRVYSKRWAMWQQEANIWADALKNLQHNSAKQYAANLAQAETMNNNISYADKDGNFGFRHTGKLPIRAAGVDPRLPSKGDGSQDWLGLQDHSQSPSLFNPSQGYIHAWNNKPTPDSNYGDGARWGKHFRTHLPVELIEGKEKISMQDLMEFNKIISASYYSVNLKLTSPKYFRPYFEQAIAATDDPRIKQAAQLMADWDGLFTDADNDGYYDHAGQTLFHSWLTTALETIFNDDIGGWWHKLDDEIYIPYQTSLLLRALEGKAAGLPMQYDYLNGETRIEVVLKSLAATLAKLDKNYSDRDLANWRQPQYWRYLQYGDAISGTKPTMSPRRSTTYSGGATMLRYLPKVMPDNGAPGWLAVMEIDSDKPYYYSAIPSGGQSWFINTGWKASPHINDQYKLYQALEFKKVHLDKNTIIKEQQSHLTIRAVK